jgi:hypothetical protein
MIASGSEGQTHGNSRDIESPDRTFAINAVNLQSNQCVELHTYVYMMQSDLSYSVPNTETDRIETDGSHRRVCPRRFEWALIKSRPGEPSGLVR